MSSGLSAAICRGADRDIGRASATRTGVRRLILAVFRHLVEADKFIAFLDQGRHHFAHQLGGVQMDAMHQHHPAILAADFADIALGAGMGRPAHAPAVPVRRAHHIAVARHGGVAADVPIDRPDIAAQLGIGVENAGMVLGPAAIRRAEIEFGVRRHQRRDLFMRHRGSGPPGVRIGVIAGAQKGMGGAVIGQQMSFAGDAGEYFRMAMGLVADDEEGGLDAQLLQRIQHFFGMGVGAVIESERDGVGIGRPEWKMLRCWNRASWVSGFAGCPRRQVPPKPAERPTPTQFSA